MSKLLERVRQGKYSIPTWMPEDAKSLIQQMLQVVPEQRIVVIAFYLLAYTENNAFDISIY